MNKLDYDGFSSLCNYIKMRRNKRFYFRKKIVKNKRKLIGFNTSSDNIRFFRKGDMTYE